MSRSFGIILLFGLGACAGADEDTGIELPPEDSGYPEETGEQSFPVDTEDTAPRDIVPEHTLTFSSWGSWQLSPYLGPYTDLTGELHVQEYLDGARPPDPEDTGAEPVALPCDLEYNLVGTTVEAACPGCTFVFEVTPYLISGDPSGCRDHELPKEGVAQQLGYHHTKGSILHNVDGSNVWITWFEAEQRDDAILFRWEKTVAITIEEE